MVDILPMTTVRILSAKPKTKLISGLHRKTNFKTADICMELLATLNHTIWSLRGRNIYIIYHDKSLFALNEIEYSP